MRHFRLSFPILIFSAFFIPALFPGFAAAKPADIVNAVDFPKAFAQAQPSVRPSRSLTYLSPGGHFMVHYDTSGYHAVAADYNYHPTVPDYVYCAAQYLEDSYDMLHDSLGFSPPPQDQVESPEIDAYFLKYNNMYGETYPEQQIEPQVWTSYLTLCSDLEDSVSFFTTGLEGLKVTCAHELFHVFQLGYKYRSSDYFYFEMSSVWFEEFMYPEVNDYHSYFGVYTGNWNYALDHASLYYNNTGFNISMDSRYSQNGDNVIKAVWEQMLNQPALDAISTVLEQRNGSMLNALCDWGTAQVLCAPYSAVNYFYPFDDAALLPTISFSRYPDHVINGSDAAIGLSSAPMTSYYKFSGRPASSQLIDFSFPENMQAKLVALNGLQSKVYAMNRSPLIIDASQYPEWILVVAATEIVDSAAIHIRTLESDQITGVTPNPAASSSAVTLHYILTDTRERGSFTLYDIRGHLIHRKELSAGLLSPGPQELSFEYLTLQLSSGIYFIVLELDGQLLSSKMTILK